MVNPDCRETKKYLKNDSAPPSYAPERIKTIRGGADFSMKNNTNGRLLAQTWSCRPYQDNYDKVMEICEETGRKPAEVLRDAIDEWLLMRNADATGADAPPTEDRQSDLEAKIEELRQDIRLLAERHEELARSIDYVQRRDHGYLLEIFLAAYGARDLMWRYISNRMRQGKQAPESILAQYEALKREWNAQCNARQTGSRTSSGKEETMLRLNIDRPDSPSRTRSRIESVYNWIAGNDDYQRNDHNLRQIQFCVITVVMIS